MTTKSIKQSVALAQKLRHIFVATADVEGLPHVAPAAAMDLVAESGLAHISNIYKTASI